MEIAERAKVEGRTDLINPANITTYLNKLRRVLNGAVKEELMDRNPAQGQRIPDPTARRDKRLPFSPHQLQTIFSAPLHTGCRDDGHGYATPGPERPKNARFWIPLLSMFDGLSLISRAVDLHQGWMAVNECRFGSCVGLVPPHEASVQATVAQRVRLHPRVAAVVDGDGDCESWVATSGSAS